MAQLLNKNKAFFFVLFILLIKINVYSQQGTISGYIKEAKNGEDIFGASIIVVGLNNVGCKTNSYGFYSLTLDTGSYILVYRSSGFQNQEMKINLKENQRIDVNLIYEGAVQEVNEVKVTAVKENSNITNSSMAVTTFDPKSIETIPVLFGEKDIIKIFQMTPGVKSAGEGNAGFYVRGGGADQNLVLLDEAPVYNASHLLGFFSVFNSDALKDASLYKSGIPAEYGGRASSVLDVKMREGNNKKLGVTGGIGLIASRLSIEAPIVKNKGSFLISGRRSYADMFLKLSKNYRDSKAKLYFYDLNLKANYQITQKDRLYLSGYLGRDVFSLSDFGFGWGNSTATLRWNRLISNKLFSNTSLIYSDFNYEFSNEEQNTAFGIKSSIVDWNLKQDFNYYANSNNSIKFGLNAIYHIYKPGAINSNQGILDKKELDQRYAMEYGAYFQNDQKFGSKLNIMYGIRYSGFSFLGDSKAYTFDENGLKTSETSYKKFETIKYYHGLEPRLSASYILTEKNSIKLGYNRNLQYLHQLSNSTSSSPTDSWVPSSNNIKPQISNQIALGYYQNFKDNMYHFTTEIYYKTLANQIDYKNGASLLLNNEVEGELVYGKGRAYGLEIQLEKKKGKFTGWIAYTLSRSLRTFDKINEGKEFAARQDRIHDISVVMMYKVNKSVSLSSTFIYYTGSAVTFPSGKYVINGAVIPYFTERNGYRMPNYHRADIGLTWYLKDKKRFEHDLNISVYNVYARANAFIIRFKPNAEDPTKTEAVQTSLFRFVPALTYNFRLK